MINDLAEVFERIEEENPKFENVPGPKLYRQADMCGFHLLTCLVPSTSDIVESAEHDIIWLSTDCVQLAKIATEDHIRYLISCGIWYDNDSNSLAMFV